METSLEKLSADGDLWTTLVEAQIVLLDSLVTAPKTTIARSATARFSSILAKVSVLSFD